MIQIINKGILKQLEDCLADEISKSKEMPSHDNILKLNVLIDELMEAGIYSLLDLLYVYATDGGTTAGAGDLGLQARTMNLANPTNFTTASVVQDNISGTNVTANQGIKSCSFTMGYNYSSDSTNFTRDDGSLFCYIYDNIEETTGVMGESVSSGVTNLILPRNVGNTFQGRLNSSTTTSVSNSDSSGLFMVQRVSSSQVKLWRNGSLLTTGSSTSSAVPSRLAIVGANSSGSGGVSTRLISVAGVASGLSGLESSLNTIITKYVNSL